MFLGLKIDFQIYLMQTAAAGLMYNVTDSLKDQIILRSLHITNNIKHINWFVRSLHEANSIKVSTKYESLSLSLFADKPICVYKKKQVIFIDVMGDHVKCLQELS